MLGGAESSHQIFEVGILGVHLHPTLAIVSDMSRDARVEDERQRVDRGIRSRVEIVYLIVFMESLAQTIHATVKTSCLLAERSQSILTVRGVCAALSLSGHGCGNHGCGNEYFLHFSNSCFYLTLQHAYPAYTLLYIEQQARFLSKLNNCLQNYRKKTK